MMSLIFMQWTGQVRKAFGEGLLSMNISKDTSLTLPDTLAFVRVKL